MEVNTENVSFSAQTVCYTQKCFITLKCTLLLNVLTPYIITVAQQDSRNLIKDTQPNIVDIYIFIPRWNFVLRHAHRMSDATERDFGRHQPSSSYILRRNNMRQTTTPPRNHLPETTRCFSLSPALQPPAVPKINFSSASQSTRRIITTQYSTRP